MSKYVFNRFNDSEEYRQEVIEMVRRLCNFEIGGYRLYDGTGTHYMQNPVEITDFIFALKRAEKELGRPFASFLEIGYASGINNTFLNKFFQFKQLVAIDLVEGAGVNPAAFMSNLRFKNMTLLAGNSHDEDVIRKAKILGGYDVIFIDGSHSYDGVKLDFQNYSPLLNKGGAIGFHDVKSVICPGVPKFWGELKKEYSDQWNFTEFFDSDNHTDYGIGMITKR